MDDIKYQFKQIEMERKRTGRGSFARVNGSHSRKCSLPSDNLTAKQLKERNGKVNTYNLNKVICWEDFKHMPQDLKREYLQKLYDHGGRGKDIAELMGIAQSAYGVYVAKHLPDMSPAKKTIPLKYESPRWKEYVRFLKGEVPAEDIDDGISLAKEPIVEEVKPTVEKIVARQIVQPKEYPKNLTMNFEGYPIQVLNLLSDCFDPEKQYIITVIANEMVKLPPAPDESVSD